ncbi:hypothetical protein BFJ67_g1169 [Fusarium oxysporum f. sp. cepae]|nr:hypothetical protein BFJ67_g1169 [Fusarium oxysporum f. sp. cepae]
MCILWLESTAYRYTQVRDVIHFEPNSTLARVYSLPPGFDSSRQVLTRQRQRDSLFALLLHALRRHLCSVRRSLVGSQTRGLLYIIDIDLFSFTTKAILFRSPQLTVTTSRHNRLDSSLYTFYPCLSP